MIKSFSRNCFIRSTSIVLTAIEKPEHILKRKTKDMSECVFRRQTH